MKRVIRITQMDHGWEIVFTKKHIFGMSTHIVQGSGTVWHFFPSGKRCPTLLESWLVDKIEQYRMACKAALINSKAKEPIPHDDHN